MVKILMDEIIIERKKKHMEDDYGIQECWNKMIAVLSQDVYETIAYLESCSEDQMYYVSEVLEDVSAKLQSKDYILCLRKLDEKFPDLQMTEDIDLAEEMII